MDKNELQPAAAAQLDAQAVLVERANDLLDTMIDYKVLMTGYACALKQIKTKLEILDAEFRVRYQRDPISSIQTRLKSHASIVEKMGRKGIPVTMENIEASICDIAGLRVICSYVDDIYHIADLLSGQEDITVLRRKDYIAHPKRNGYRSLHLIVEVPVYFSEGRKNIKAEIQIRTIAMDFWASLEHEIRYKKNLSDDADIYAQLRECAERSAATDLMMQKIRERADAAADARSDVDAVYDKLRKFDAPII